MPDPQRYLLGVTPHVPIPARWQVLGAREDGDVVRRGEEHHPVTLTGVEVGLFREVGDVDALARQYGWLGLGNAAMDVPRERPSEWPLWYRLLTGDPGEHGYLAEEPVADWARQGGLLDVAYGLLGLLRHPASRRAIRTLDVEAIRRDPAEYRRRWPVVSLRDGARRAGLRVAVREAPEALVASIHEGPSWERPSWLPHGAPALQVPLTRRGIEGGLRVLLNPWLARLAPVLVEEGGRMAQGYRQPGDLLGVLWVQLANAVLSEVPPRACAWERCPGPPKRPRVFVWRWGTGDKRRSAMFCHPLCKAAAAQAAHRASPGKQRKEEER